MRKTFSRALVICAIATVSAFGADNSLGTWKVNLAKSQYTPAPIPLKKYMLTREAAPGGVKVTILGERTDGTIINATYTAKFDGSATAVEGSGSPYDTISVKQVNANAFTYEAKKTGGKYQATGRFDVSKDGKTLTLSATGTDPDGKAMSLTLVSEKQ
jgi:2',3'-cyclic-nucleotide 2'-phosphodiesterase (5'-nucleotidase family)